MTHLLTDDKSPFFSSLEVKWQWNFVYPRCSLSLSLFTENSSNGHSPKYWQNATMDFQLLQTSWETPRVRRRIAMPLLLSQYSCKLAQEICNTRKNSREPGFYSCADTYHSHYRFTVSIGQSVRCEKTFKNRCRIPSLFVQAIPLLFFGSKHQTSFHRQNCSCA